MELSSKILEQSVHNTRPKQEEHLVRFMDKSTHVEPLSQQLKTNNKQFKIAVTILTGYNGIFNVTDKNSKFFFTKSIDDEKPRKVSILPGAYELENLDEEIKRIVIEQGRYTEDTYRFKIKPNFSTLGSDIELSPYKPGSYIDFRQDDSLKDYSDLQQNSYLTNIIYPIIQLIFYHFIILF